MRDTGEKDDDDTMAIQSVLTGNRNAFRLLVEKYQAAVSAVGNRTIGSPEDVSDFVQEVFLKAFSHLHQYSGRGRFYSWLMRIAYTTAINLTTRTLPEVPTDPDVLARLWQDPRKYAPDRTAERSMLWESILGAIRELPRQLALSVELFFLLGLRYGDSAEITGAPVNTLKSHIYRARAMLQARLGPSTLEDYHDV